MPSFDIVSEITMHEVKNAVDNANRDLSNRWDFRNVSASIELNERTCEKRRQNGFKSTLQICLCQIWFEI